MSDPVLIKTLDFFVEAPALLTAARQRSPAFLLDSSLMHPQKGRYSFVGFDPFFVYRSKGKDPFPELRSRFLKFRRESKRSAVPFCGGIVGYVAYDVGFSLEKIRLRSADDLKLPDCHFGFYDSVVIVDQLRRKVYLAASGLPEKAPLAQRRRAQDRLQKMARWVREARDFSVFPQGPSPGRGPAPQRGLSWQSNFTPQTFQSAVRKAKEYIRRGDIYQVNLAQRFDMEMEKAGGRTDPIEIYFALRALSPSCFSGYLDCGDFQLISSSPERFLKLQGGIVETSPMKGTRPRGRSQTLDRRLREELRKSPKEKAELLMITDLERNDLGRVCDFGSIGVRSMRSVESYKTVYQATSTVQGRLRADKDGFDLLSACFPGGSVTGCPKIRAMEVIEELEPVRRGPYTGAFGYMDFGGDMDFNVLIRTLVLKGRKVYFHVGSGIVADSSPAAEYAETLIKARAMQQSLRSGR